jgi:hypothetical protein
MEKGGTKKVGVQKEAGRHGVNREGMMPQEICCPSASEESLLLPCA